MDTDGDTNDFKVPFSGVGAKYTEYEKRVVQNAMNSETTFTQGTELSNLKKNSQNLLRSTCFCH